MLQVTGLEYTAIIKVIIITRFIECLTCARFVEHFTYSVSYLYAIIHPFKIMNVQSSIKIILSKE